MKKLYFITLIIIIMLMSACAQKEDGLYAVFETNMGSFTCELYYEKVPVTVGSFVGLAEGDLEFTDTESGRQVKKPFFEGLIFHRIIKDFMIQGGCPLGKGYGGPGYSFIDEIDPTLVHDSEGILSMANSGPNSNGSQFFITLGPTPHLDGKHAVFGKITEGMDVIKKIGEVKTNDQDKPYEDVYIKKISIVREGEDAKKFDAVKAFNSQAEVVKQKRKDFFAKIGVDESKIESTEAGLQYFVRNPGTGAVPAKGQSVVVHYIGYLEDGRIFDSSVARNQPFSFAVGTGNVIPGWDEAFLNMKEGEKRVLIIPHYLAYGERGYPGAIPPKATLIFDVELIEIEK